MTRNVKGTHRWLRVLLGVAVLLLAFVGPRTNWGFLGLMLIATGLAGYCPVSRLFGRARSRGGRNAPA